MHGLENLGRHRSLEELLRSRREIADALPVAGFILHLNHDYGALRVGFLKVSHDSGECLLVRFE
jgi:hypothetical protein